MKKIVYVDMDNVLFNFSKARDEALLRNPSIAFPHSQVDFFRKLEPIENAMWSIKTLDKHFDTYILTAPSTLNPMSYMEKMLCIRDHLGQAFIEKLIISKHKHLNKGDYLIDDMASGCGQDKFEGELIQFGSEKFPNWQSVINYLVGSYV
jgi:5'(3')-deoxyribonucleotidase